MVVGGAILLTGWVLSRDPAGSGPSTSSTVEASDIDADVVLACVPALETVCSSAASALGVAFDVWEAGDPIPDRGVVLAPAADFPDGTELGPVLAETPIVIAGWRTRWQPLELACGDRVDAACVGSSLGRTWAELGGNSAWGDFKVGLADPTASEQGMAAWSVVQPALGASADALAGSLRVIKDSDADLMEELVLFASRADLVVTTEVAVAAQFQNAIARGGGRIEIGYPESGPWIEYVSVGSGRGSGSLVEQLAGPDIATVFTENGLRPAAGVSGPLPDGLGTPGAKTPSPDGPTRATLIAAWEEHT
jgi:hypothetical protein